MLAAFWYDDRHMESFFIVVSVLQTMAISLGVGSSTFAILNFFTAISDGEIDASERRMMGMVYIVLRIAMVLILLTSATLAYITYREVGLPQISPMMGAFWTLIAVLYINAGLMTVHKISSKIGPGLQAGTWYMLGIFSALTLHVDLVFTYSQFVAWYTGFVLFVILIVNIVMKHLQKNIVRKKKAAGKG